MVNPLRRKNRDAVTRFPVPEKGERGVESSAPPSIPPNPLVAVRDSLRIRLKFLDDSVQRHEEDKLQMQREMESLQKQILEMDRALLAGPILAKLAELYK